MRSPRRYCVKFDSGVAHDLRNEEFVWEQVCKQKRPTFKLLEFTKKHEAEAAAKSVDVIKVDYVLARYIRRTYHGEKN